MLKRMLALVLALLALSMACLADELTVTFLDVGQGDAALITCGGMYMLVDTGSNRVSNQVMAFLSAQGVTKLDYLVGTHPHEEHIGGFVRILGQLDVDNVWLSRVNFPSELQEAVEQALTEKGIEAQRVALEHRVTLGDATVTVVGPLGNEYDVLHDHSVVLRIDHGNNRFLLMGDAEAESEREMLDSDLEISTDVLKVGSHGDTAASSADFLRAVSPRYAVISCGTGMAQETVVQALRQAGAEVLTTDARGNITLVSDGATIILREEGDSNGADAGASDDAPTAGIVQEGESSIEAGEGGRRFGKTNVKGINVRSEPDAKATRFATIGVTGTKLEIYESIVSTDGSTWYRVKINGTDGYILGSLVDLISEEEYLARSID